MSSSKTTTSISKRIFPGCYGLLVYFTVRLLQDSDSGLRFWRRAWWITVAEIGCAILVGYVLILIVDAMLRRFDRARTGTGRSPRIAREIGAIFLVNLVIENLIFTPLAAFTDNGLQWGDLVAINVIPLLYTLIYYGYRRSREWLDAYTNEKIKAEKMANDQLATELQFLKAQYHPHFLFNALNTIYFQMDEDVPGAKKTLEQFSGLLRYQLYDSQEKVPLEREIQYLANYVALQKARSEDKLQLDLCLPQGELPASIYPLLLLPLVENAFKYTGGSQVIFIQLELRGKQLEFKVSNSTGSAPTQKPGGIGLENLRRRLVLLYPDKHSFRSAASEQQGWLATLSIDLS